MSWRAFATASSQPDFDAPGDAERAALADDLFAWVGTGPPRSGAEELVDHVGRAAAFARVTPEDKLRIVESLQAAGQVVAVTGDGVNDAPTLSQADVGVAMGSGTDAARDAAGIVLLDDEFQTITTAVAEGRRIFTNIRRFAQFLFSWHLAEVAVIVVALAAAVLGLVPVAVIQGGRSVRRPR